ncbi:MAG: hypothetical protein SH850_01840 [Planctomycetaceae bacterium]|nr:hypothetical protein [Planctomycetaceae bacterium]
MSPKNRREFLSDVGRGMLVAGVGTAVATDLGFSTAFADRGAESLKLGPYESLVELLRSTPPDKLQPILIAKLKAGEVDNKQLISAGALANAEAFGGQDYVGYHTAMAMLPALQMTKLLPKERQSLPVLKVLYRNSQQCQSHGGASKATLTALHAAEHSPEGDMGLKIRDACREADMNKAEALFGSLAKVSPREAFNAIQPAVQDDINVHRFVFAHRTYGMIDLLGQDYAHTLLRQSVRQMVDFEQDHKSRKQADNPIRALLPKLLDQYKLAGMTPGKKPMSDAAVDDLARTVYNGPPARSADAVAAALADGVDIEVVGEAISLASNMLCLRQGTDRWRTHGDSAGVHSSDATNAFRNMARNTDSRHGIAGMIVAAYHSASHTPFSGDAYPLEEHRQAVKATDARGLLAECEEAVKANDQARASAAIQIYGEQGHPVEPVFQSLIKYTISEDGRLHGEKFFHTVGEEFRATRPAFRWRQITALARVTASAYGYNRDDKQGFHAPGYEDACNLLGIEA